MVSKNFAIILGTKTQENIVKSIDERKKKTKRLLGTSKKKSSSLYPRLLPTRDNNCVA
jgi:hypothetical protein